MADIKPSEDPKGWVEHYLKEHVKMELEGDCILQPPLDPQFDLYVTPIIRSYVTNMPDLKARHVLIVPIMAPAEEFGSAEEQLIEIRDHIKPVFDEDYFIYEYDTKTGWGEMYLSSDSNYLMRLIEHLITKKDANEEAANGHHRTSLHTAR